MYSKMDSSSSWWPKESLPIVSQYFRWSINLSFFLMTSLIQVVCVANKVHLYLWLYVSQYS